MAPGRAALLRCWPMVGAATARPALRPLGHRDFRLLLAGSAIVGVLMPLHLLTQVFWVSQHFPDSAIIYSSVLAASRGAGMVVFSLLGGAIADRADRKRVLLACESLSLGAHAVIAVLMIVEPLGDGTVALVALWTFMAAGVQSIDSPARSASVPGAAGRENLAAAIALLSISNQLTMPLSLPLAGILNDVMSPGVVYASTLLAWVAILPLISMLRLESTGGGGRTGVLSSIRDGLRYARASRPIFAVVATVMVVQIIGMPVATPLGPMFEIEVLGFTTTQVGLMGATWGLGSLTASVGLARVRGLALRGSSLAAVATLFGVGVLGFGYSRFVPLTAVADYAMGFAFTGTMLVATTLTQHLVADEVRGRVLSLFPLSLGLAQAGTAIAGLVGERVGLAVLLPALGWLVVAGCIVLVVSYRDFIGARVIPNRSLEPSLVGPAD